MPDLQDSNTQKEGNLCKICRVNAPSYAVQCVSVCIHGGANGVGCAGAIGGGGAGANDVGGAGAIGGAGAGAIGYGAGAGAIGGGGGGGAFVRSRFSCCEDF